MAVEAQQVIDGLQPLSEKIYAAGGVVLLEHLINPEFDPEQPMTMAEYSAEIGRRLSPVGRDPRTNTDRALGVFRQDFDRARPQEVAGRVYFPRGEMRQRPRKSVVMVHDGHNELNESYFPGIVPPSTGVAVSEVIYEEMVQNAPYFYNRIANKTEAKKLRDIEEGKAVDVEAIDDEAGESGLYGLIQKHEILEARNYHLLAERSLLAAVYRCVALEDQKRRIQNLEPHRVAAMKIIQEMVRVSCKIFAGTNLTKNTMNAVASNLTRAQEPNEHWIKYTHMAMRHNDAVRDKVNQSIRSVISEIGLHRVHAINNINREYTK